MIQSPLLPREKSLLKTRSPGFPCVPAAPTAYALPPVHVAVSVAVVLLLEITTDVPQRVCPGTEAPGRSDQPFGVDGGVKTLVAQVYVDVPVGRAGALEAHW